MSHDGDGGRLVLQRSPRVVRGQTEAPDVLYTPGSCQVKRRKLRPHGSGCRRHEVEEEIGQSPRLVV